MPSAVRPKSRPKKPPSWLELEVDKLLKDGWNTVPKKSPTKKNPANKRLPAKKHPFPVQTG